MANEIEWPLALLTPGVVTASVVPFTRSGGTTLGGFTPTTRTDRGFWNIEYGAISLRNKTRDQFRALQAMRQKLGGRAGLVIVPVRSPLSAPYASGRYEPVVYAGHSDGEPLDDGTEYVQGAIVVKAEGTVSAGETSISLRVLKAGDDLSGVRFSYNNALYETGPVTSIDGDVWTVPISPPARETIPAGADLEFDRPTCLCRLSEDRGLDFSEDVLRKSTSISVSFVEAVDYWSA